MAYVNINRLLSLTFSDERKDTRTRRVEVATTYDILPADIDAFVAASKSTVRNYWLSNENHDSALAAGADSEVKDTLRLFFLAAGDKQVHFDIPDPADDVFLSTTGPGANILMDYADLADIGASASQSAVADIIDQVTAGNYLVSDGEIGATFLFGERI